MGADIDIGGLESLIDTLETVKNDIPKMNEGFLHDEWYVFLRNVVPITPRDTGFMESSYDMGGVRHSGTITEADWTNNAEYSGFVNYGTVRMRPRYFWERGLNFSEAGRESRYAAMLREKFEGG